LQGSGTVLEDEVKADEVVGDASELVNDVMDELLETCADEMVILEVKLDTLLDELSELESVDDDRLLLLEEIWLELLNDEPVLEAGRDALLLAILPVALEEVLPLAEEAALLLERLRPLSKDCETVLQDDVKEAPLLLG
jgi:hypothetical protein